jgi:hypothetical protein
MTIVDCPVRLVKEAGAVQKVAEARTFEAVLAPLDLGRGAAPGFPLAEYRCRSQSSAGPAIAQVIDAISSGFVSDEISSYGRAPFSHPPGISYPPS